MATYKLNFDKHWESGLGDDFTIGDLQAKDLLDELQPLTLHFGHLLTEWNTNVYPAVKLEKPVNKFYGGMGEGQEFDTWQDAVHASLYDAFQVYSELKDGDVFIAEYNGETQYYSTLDKIHIVKIENPTRS